MCARNEVSCDNISADNELNDLVDEGYKNKDSTDSCADMPPLVCHSGSRMSDSSSDSYYQTESDKDDSNEDEEYVFSSSGSDDKLYGDDGYESEDSCTNMSDLVGPNLQVGAPG